MICSEPKKIGDLEIKNRFIRSATYEHAASEDGRITDELIRIYKTLAKGGVGLIIPGMASVQQNGIGFPRQIEIDRDDLIPGLKKLTETIHEHGDGCKVAIQLSHCGRESMFLDEVVAPSAIFEPTYNMTPKEMKIEDIEDTIKAFVEGARRAKEAGFDGIQLHSCHGFLLSGFLSPYTNRRTDEYGGNFENRMRIIDEIYKRTVELLGKDFSILIKINVDDYLEGGINLEESMKIAERLSKMGFSAIEISSTMWETATRTKEEIGWETYNPFCYSRFDIDSKKKEAYHLPYAKEIKKIIDVPLILVGGIRSLSLIEEILENEDADFISLCRPLIREPDLPNKWLNGTGEDTCKCTSCNGCMGSLVLGPLGCIQEK